MGHSNVSGTGSTPFRQNRWVQLAIGIVCMGLVANLQYAWTLFVVPMDNAHHWGQAAIQTAFTVFIVTETTYTNQFGQLCALQRATAIRY